MKIVVLEPERIPLVNRFYQAENSPHRAGRHELVLVAYEESQILAALRVKLVKHHQLVTGLVVTPAHRRRGLARALLKQLCQMPRESNNPYYAFIEPYLWPLYQGCGFKHSQQAMLPELLLAQLKSLQKNKGEFMAVEYC